MRFISLPLFLIAMLPLQALAQAPAQGYTLNDDLIYRINFGSAEDVRMLLSKGADPNTVTRQGESALDVAIERNDAESPGMAIAIIDKGADVNAVDKAGNAPIVNAIRHKQTAVVKELFTKGVDFHTHTADGMDLVSYAKQNGDLESAQLISDMVAKEEAYAASLRSPDRFKGMVRDYTMDSCVYQYWSYFLASRQNPEKDDETNKKIATIKSAIFQLITNIQKYYPTASITSLHNASSQAVNQIFAQLDGMISNRNRVENGIGKEEDATARCQKIVQGMQLDFAPPPAPPGSAPAQPAAAPAGTSPATPSTPLPMEPAGRAPGAPKAP